VNIPDGKLVISVPSAVHSHKPPLTGVYFKWKVYYDFATHTASKVKIKILLKFLEIIKEYLPNEPKCLEIFARYLLPGWTSWGLEILKFQHLSLYEILDESRQADDIKNENECNG